MTQTTKKAYRKRSDSLNLEKLSFRTPKERSYVDRRVKELCRKLQGRRKALKLSQEKLAELTSVSLATIKFIEQGQRIPSFAMFFKILYVLDRDAPVWDSETETSSGSAKA